MTYSLHPGAEGDLASVLDFYRAAAGVEVARRFLVEFERVMRLLVENPEFGTPTSLGRRTYPLRIFPYAVVYRALDSTIRVLVLRHQHQHPKYGGRRR